MNSPFKSPVWRHFKLKSDDPKIGICQIFIQNKKSTDSEVKRNENIKNLGNHLENYHTDEFKSLKGIQEKMHQSTLTSGSQNRLTFNVCTQSKHSINRLIAEMIVIDCHLYSIVDDEGFRKLIKFAFPNYEIPGRDFFTSYINKMYEENVEKVKEDLLKAQYVTLTSDLWTAILNESYATITAHFIEDKNYKNYVLDTKPFGSARHTGENIKIIFEATIAKWGLDKKIIAIVTDNAYNIVNAVHFSDNISIRCSAHTLQLAIQDAFEDQQKLEEILAKCRSIVGHFKHSSQSSANIKKYSKYA